MRTQSLTWDEQFAFERLVLKSITSRYQGELERWGSSHGRISYAPVDTSEIHDLLVDLWGEHITRDTLDRLEQELCEEGADRDEWGPKAYCEEDDEEERERDEAYAEYWSDLAEGNI
jgi:hypothetical protein